ncbi:ABC transporter substrate-binding protein [Alkalihalobacterium elongatum]|uniref:ABC transporter substrate-binding protein n=1 Tax=Alkalihalobacterium elongatum TaxID=2675466 RepID=UPI001C1FAC51|nr:ABC transporter substrate-binding protein [Alkalihalobacterium elongatum]
MKKIIIFCVGMFFFLLLAACSESSSSPAPSNSDQNEEANESQDEQGELNLSQGVTDDEILIGHLGPQTGPAGFYDYVRQGIDLYFNYINENGGVDGRQLKLVAYDDQYQPAKTVQMASRIVEQDQVFAILGQICSPCIAAVKDYYEEVGVPVLLMQAGAKEFVEPPIANFFGAGLVNYRYEAKVLLDYAINELDAEKIAVVYQNDDFGKEGLAGVLEGIENYSNAEIVTEITYVSGDSDLSSQAQKLKESGADAVIVYGLSNPLASLKREMHRIGLTDMAFLTSAVSNSPEQFKLAGEDVWNGTYGAQFLPLPDFNSDDEQMKLFLERYSAKYSDNSPLNTVHVGWTLGEFLHEALKRTGSELNWENFTEALYTFDNWDGSFYEGVSFSPDNHYGVTSLYISQAQNGELVRITDSIAFDPVTGEITYK